MVIGVMLVGMLVTFFGVKEAASPNRRPFKVGKLFRAVLFDPFKHSDFTWVFLTRLLVTMGIYTVQEFLQYYMGDVIGAPMSWQEWVW